MGYLLGLDLGTSALKTLLYDETKGVIKRFVVPYESKSPRPGWIEQDPGEWWRAVLSVFDSLKRTEASSIIAIGLTGQMHGPVFMGPEGEPLYPCITWADTRAHDDLLLIKRRFNHEEITRVTGNPPVEAFTAPKILWFKRHYPKLFRRVEKILLPKDFICFKLTGEYVTDHTDASGTLLYDIRRGGWSFELISALGLPSGIFPPIEQSTSTVGFVEAKVARECGVPRDTLVIAGAGDLATAVFGSGVQAETSALVNLGTAGQVMLLQESIPEVLGNSFLFRHPLKGFFKMGTIPAAGASLQWYAKSLESLMGKELDVDMLDELAGRSPPGSRGLFFLPYLLGTGTPHLDYRAQGCFIGLTLKHSQADMVRAIMEGVAYGLKGCLHTLDADPEEIRMGSGGARSGIWQQIIADVLGIKIIVLEEKDLSAYGACLLAGLATGIFRDPSEIYGKIRIERELMPGDAGRLVYGEGYRLYSTLYRHLRPLFLRIHAFQGLSQEVEDD